ncbi:MAG: bifunctional aspartate kinase/diaminopimelate decarboxylase [Alphaproteobacteria bacterium]|nr:bifunctional aspartate kinase/diaminopimelate decarboxylase [Alphaproteobacteria bacterium]
MDWVVLKYGGTSVATAEKWGTIARRARELSGGNRVWIVASALSQVSNRLERAIDAAVHGERLTPLETIEADHLALADALGLDAAERAPLLELLGDLRRLLEGIRLTAEASPRLRARVMSFGELASTRIGVAALRRAGLDATWVDARKMLTSSGAHQHASDAYLSAEIPVVVDPAKGDAAAGGHAVVITQGFIGRNTDGHTVLLGRGGSDTSASLFGALLQAARVEIWTDVHGMFTANPREIPTARLVKSLAYREAQELAAMGAKVLHPRCLAPVARSRIPLEIRNTEAPDAEGTRIEADAGDDAVVTAVVRRTGVTMLTLSTLDMWGAPGFLARAFAPFAELGMSIDLVATSQAAVSVTLDHIPGGTEGESFRELLTRLERLGAVRVVSPCAVVSIVGRRIRAVLHELGGAFQVFREHDVHLVSESSEDLNLSFVVDEEDAPRLTKRLHDVLFAPQAGDPRLGPSWEQLGRAPAPARAEARWWTRRVDDLHAACPEGEARYVYDLATVKGHAEALVAALSHAERLYYAIKANPHPGILALVGAAGFGMECVSIGEVRRVREVLGSAAPILFTPNFCPVTEYAEALALGAEVTIDGPDVLALAPDTFRGAELALRVDPGAGAGHHEKVVTAGAHAKFGHPAAAIASVVEASDALGIRLVGLHSHVGSGILDAGAWMRTGDVLADLVGRLPALRWIDLGGGLGVVERPGQTPLDLAALDDTLAALKARLPARIGLRMEPGRYLVSEAGVLVARVTQVRNKGPVRFVGLATGMNSLIRPALYGAWHAIHNVSRLAEAPVGYAHVVGPICETGDVLGRDRLLPDSRVGDLVLIDNAGAYGHAMSSSYNDRAPAPEVLLPV